MAPVNPSATLLLLATVVFSINTLHATSPAPIAPRGDIHDRNGVILATDRPDPQGPATTPPQRRYPFQSLASHVLGAVTQPQPEQPPVGNDGVEKMLNDELSPVPAQTENSNTGKLGQDVWLTIDARYQFIIESQLREANVGRGTAVLMDVASGQILAMASLPSFDPNHFVPQISEATFENYRKNPSVPLLNRATYPFAPGAAFMLVTALAAATNGHATDVHVCDGVFQAGPKSLSCWIQSKGGTHGRQTLDQAMENGCGLYFYGLTLGMGYDKIENFADLAGLRNKPGTGLPGEGQGFIPGPGWLEKQYADVKAASNPPWTDASSASSSVGSGKIAITPLHMTSIAATIASGGTVWKPSLIDHVGKQETKLYRRFPPTKITDLKDHGLSEQGLAVLREGMRKRTAKVMSNSSTLAPAINGFTGTMVEYRKHPVQKEYVRDRNCWYVCYAPADKPRWALTVLVQQGRSGGDTSAPIAHRILQDVAAAEAGTLKVEPKALPPTPGHWESVDAVEFPGSRVGEK
jgi:cell division protein FtsI/penicillin-binding protein 2